MVTGHCPPPSPPPIVPCLSSSALPLLSLSSVHLLHVVFTSASLLELIVILSPSYPVVSLAPTVASASVTPLPSLSLLGSALWTQKYLFCFISFPNTSPRVEGSGRTAVGWERNPSLDQSLKKHLQESRSQADTKRCWGLQDLHHSEP